MGSSDGTEVAALLARLRATAGWSQAEVAERAATSQPAVARYESGYAVPSWPTLRRLVAAFGYEVRLELQPVVDPGDLRLARELLELSVEERLESLTNAARLRSLVSTEPAA